MLKDGQSFQRPSKRSLSATSMRGAGFMRGSLKQDADGYVIPAWPLLSQRAIRDDTRFMPSVQIQGLFRSIAKINKRIHTAALLGRPEQISKLAALLANQLANVDRVLAAEGFKRRADGNGWEIVRK